jgi:quinol---cytochrome c reductase cytochrome b subunit, bacillus type
MASDAGRHPRQIQAALVEWLDERYPFTESVTRELYRRVPNYAAAFHHYLGAMVVMLIVLEFITGFLLGLYYVPDGIGNPSPAYTSVNLIQHSVYLGWLIRGVHFWGANLLIPLALLHLIYVYWTGSYRAPRELNWMVGVLMLLLILALTITGELLPWDSKTYLARSRELSILSGGSALPFQLSTLIKYLLQGGQIAGPATLQRFFMAHIFLLPGLMTLLMYLHFRFIRKHGPAPPIVLPNNTPLSFDNQPAMLAPIRDQYASAGPGENGGHGLEPLSKRQPIGPDHVLFPLVASIALPGVLMGSSGHHIADDLPADETHPFFPDHFWPFPIIATVMVVTLGLLAALVQRNLQLDVPADPRSSAVAHPDWFFLFLFQFLKLGPELVMSLVIPLLALLALLLWPLIDAGLGPRLARRLGWNSWPVPGRNVVTGSLLVGIVGFLAFLTSWSLAGPGLCLPWPINGPICGG